MFDLVDQGLQEIKPDPEIGIVLTLQPILDQSGHPASEPWLLDCAGHAIPSGLGTGPDQLVILYQNIFDKRDFTILPACSAVA